MSKKKMCKWHKKSGRTECDWQDCKAANPDKDNVCPANTNSKCEIITKPKPRMVRVKAWFTLCGGDTPWDVTFNPHMPKDTFKPCTVLIDRKYLTTRNKEK